MAQWIRIHMPVQETWVRALVWEDPACHGATKPMHHDYCSRAPSLCSTREATAGGAGAARLERSPCSPQLEKARAEQPRPSSTKKTKKKKVNFTKQNKAGELLWIKGDERHDN